MGHTVRVATGVGIFVAGCALAACSSSPTKPDALEAKGSATTTTSTTVHANIPSIPPGHGGFFVPHVNTPTTVVSGIPVPNVIGMTPPQARPALRALGFVVTQMNTACHKGTPASLSVATSLSVPGTGTDPRVGATPLTPGTRRPAHSRVGVTWSGCFPHGTIVPDVTGLAFDKAVHKLHVAGLTWACFSVPAAHAKQASTTSTSVAEAPAAKSTTSITGETGHAATVPNHTGGAKNSAPKDAASTTTTTTPHTPVVLSQGTKPGTVLGAHTAVNIVMHHCPQ